MKISFAKPALPTSGAYVVGVLAGKTLPPSAKAVDEATGGALSRAMDAARFDGKAEQSLTLLAPAGTDLDKIIVLGLGEPAKLDTLAWQSFGGAACAAVSGDKDAAIAVDEIAGSGVSGDDAAAQVAFGALLRSYRFDKYRTTEKKDDKPKLSKLHVLTEAGGAKKAFGDLEAVAEGVFLTRDLVSEPANILGPEEFAKECRKLERPA